jgi:hypothetical protein
VHVVILSLSVEGQTPASETPADVVELPLATVLEVFDVPAVVELPAAVLEPLVCCVCVDDPPPAAVDDVFSFITDGVLLLLQPAAIEAATNDSPPRTTPVIRTILMTVSSDERARA